MNFKEMNIENVHIETACGEIRKYFEDKWVGEDELLELFYLILKIKKTQTKRSERNLIEYLSKIRLLETDLYTDHQLSRYKFTKEGLDLLLEFYTIIYMGNPGNPQFGNSLERTIKK